MKIVLFVVFLFFVKGEVHVGYKINIFPTGNCIDSVISVCSPSPSNFFVEWTKIDNSLNYSETYFCESDGLCTKKKISESGVEGQINVKMDSIGGGFAGSWINAKTGLKSEFVYQIYGEDGNPVKKSDEVISTSIPESFDVSSYKQGNLFVIGYIPSSGSPEGNNKEIFFRLYLPDGNFLSQTKYSGNNLLEKKDLQLHQLADGFLTIFKGDVNNDLYATLFDSNADMVNDTISLDYFHGDETQAQGNVAIASNNLYFIVVAEDPNSYSIFGRIYDWSLNPVCDKLIFVEDSGGVKYTNPSVSAVKDGFVVAWDNSMENEISGRFVDINGEMKDKFAIEKGNALKKPSIINNGDDGFTCFFFEHSGISNHIVHANPYTFCKDKDCPSNSALSSNNIFRFENCDCTCNPGYERDGGENMGSDCVKCEKGYYKEAIGETCTKCGNKQTTMDKGEKDKNACFCVQNAVDKEGCQCDIGYTSSEDGSECVECEIAYFKDVVDDHACWRCEKGKSTLKTGSKTEDDCVCDIGYFFNNQSKCELCPLNTFKNFKGDANCTVCPEGSTTNDVGSTNIIMCICGNTFVRAGDVCVPLSTVAIIIGIGSGSFLFIIVLLILLVFFVFICLLRFKKKANRFDHIDGIDVVAKELEVEQRHSKVPKIKIDKNNHVIDFKEIKLKKVIGEGGSGTTIYLAEWKGIQCAYKGFRINPNDTVSEENPFKEFEKEVAACVNLNHPSILQFYGASIDPPKVGILMAFCQKGDLFQFLGKYKDKNNESYPLKEKIRILFEIASGMEYLHSKKMIHRDLKPENILIDGNEKSKIMDFGLTKLQKTPDQTMTKCIGTSYYMAPEVIQGRKYSNKCDVYSWAVLAYVIITEKINPFGDDISQAKILKNVSSDPYYRPEISNESFRDCKELLQIIQKSWSYKPEERYSFSEISSHISKFK